MKYLLLPLTIIIHFSLLFGNLTSSFWQEGSRFFYDLSSTFIFMPESGLALNNLGNTEYQQNNYPKAIEYYESAFNLLEESKPKAASTYNLGNSYFRQGQIVLFGNTYTFFPLNNRIEITMAQVKETIELWENSIASYEECLKLTPDDTECKENLEFVKKQLEYLLNSEISNPEGDRGDGDDGDDDDNDNDNEPDDDEINTITDRDQNGQTQNRGQRGRDNWDGTYDGPTW